MLDARLLRQDPEAIAAALGRRGFAFDVAAFVQLETRRARPDDCICSNESAYYPPLTELANFAPGVTTVGES